MGEALLNVATQPSSPFLTLRRSRGRPSLRDGLVNPGQPPSFAWKKKIRKEKLPFLEELRNPNS